eukprot:scaffold1248_cov393-Prasinococcus_capsulatus_cf.AAC.22
MVPVHGSATHVEREKRGAEVWTAVRRVVPLQPQGAPAAPPSLTASERSGCCRLLVFKEGLWTQQRQRARCSVRHISEYSAACEARRRWRSLASPVARREHVQLAFTILRPSSPASKAGSRSFRLAASGPQDGRTVDCTRQACIVHLGPLEVTAQQSSMSASCTERDAGGTSQQQDLLGPDEGRVTCDVSNAKSRCTAGSTSECLSSLCSSCRVALLYASFSWVSPFKRASSWHSPGSGEWLGLGMRRRQ